MAPPWVAGGPTTVLQVTGAQQNDGRVQLWVTDQKQQLWSIAQTSPGGGWSAWSGPNWNGAAPLMEICACQQGGTRGAQLWGITGTNGLVSTFQETPGGKWSAWMPAPWVAGGPTAVLIATAQQNNGQVQLWVLDLQQQIWSIWQTSPGGGGGVGRTNWGGSQKLQTIAASQQGGTRGAQLWATDLNDQLWSTSGVSRRRLGALARPELGGRAAFHPGGRCEQNNGCVQVWGIDQNGSVKSITQTSPGGGWSAWGP